MSFLRKGILVSGGQIANIAIHVVAGVILRRALGPDGVGQYNLFQTTGTLAVTFAALGLGNANIYFLNNRKTPIADVVTNTIKVGLLMGLALAAALGVVIWCWTSYFGVVSPYTVVVFSLGMSAGLNYHLLRPVLVAQLAAKRMVTVEITRTIVLLIGVGVLALAACLDPDGAIIVLALGDIGAVLLVLAFISPHIQLGRRFDWPLLGQVVVFGVKLAGANLLTLLAASTTVILLRWFRQDSFTDVGLYNGAAAVGGLITLVPTAMGQLLFAKFASAYGADRVRQVEMAIRMNLAYGLIGWLGLVAVGKYLIWALYGAEFLPATAALYILAPGLAFMTVATVSNNLLVSDGRVGATAGILLGTLCIVFTTTWLLVPGHGIRGAALAVLFGNAFTACVSLAVCQRLYGLKLRNCLVLRRSDVDYVIRAVLPRRNRGPAPESIERPGDAPDSTQPDE